MPDHATEQRSEFLLEASVVEAMGMTGLRLLVSAHDPDAARDLIFIRTRKPVTLRAFERRLRERATCFEIYQDFCGAKDPKYKADMEFLARAKRNGDPTYVRRRRRA